jgi:hypothetical protein
MFQLIAAHEGMSLSSGTSGNRQVSLTSCYFVPLSFIHHITFIFMLSALDYNLIGNPIRDSLLVLFNCSLKPLDITLLMGSFMLSCSTWGGFN